MKCHDCGKEIKFNGDKIVNGRQLCYKNKLCIFKCDDCDDVLRNYQDCEVYSRIVGYLRPTNTWNEGKKQEFSERKEYEV